MIYTKITQDRGYVVAVIKLTVIIMYRLVCKRSANKANYSGHTSVAQKREVT